MSNNPIGTKPEKAACLKHKSTTADSVSSDIDKKNETTPSNHLDLYPEPDLMRPDQIPGY